jgi:hypothetical protein
MHIYKLLLLLVVSVLTACVQVPANNDSRVSNLAVTSVWDTPTKFSTGSKFSISLQRLNSVAIKNEAINNAYQLYSDGIESNLHSRGYQKALNASSAAFHVKFILALSEDLDDQAISEQFGITPGLQDSKDLNKGSFLISIIDVNTGQRVWHGAIQGFVQEETTELEKAQRRSYVINMVLAQFHKPQ